MGLAFGMAVSKTSAMLLETLKRHWWVPVLRGVAAIIFGVIAFTHPVMAAATLVLFFGAWVLIDGIFRVIGAIGHHASDPDWGFNLIIGILGIIIGLLTFHAPGITALALVIYIAAWALMIGATEIALAIKMRREIKGEWFLILMGLASIVFRGSSIVEPARRCGGADLDYRLVRSDNRVFWQSFLAFACAACRHCAPLDRRQTVRDFCELEAIDRFCRIVEASSLGQRVFCATNAMAAGLLKKNAAWSD